MAPHSAETVQAVNAALQATGSQAAAKRQLSWLQRRAVNSNAMVVVVSSLVSLAVPYAVFSLVVVWVLGAVARLNEEIVGVAYEIGAVLVLIAAMSGVVVVWRERQRVLGSCAATPPATPGEPCACRICGGPVLAAAGSVTTRCAFCGADNIVSAAVVARVAGHAARAIHRTSEDLIADMLRFERRRSGALIVLLLMMPFSPVGSLVIGATLYERAVSIPVRYAVFKTPAGRCLFRVHQDAYGRAWFGPESDYSSPKGRPFHTYIPADDREQMGARALVGREVRTPIGTWGTVVAAISSTELEVDSGGERYRAAVVDTCMRDVEQKGLTTWSLKPIRPGVSPCSSVWLDGGSAVLFGSRPGSLLVLDREAGTFFEIQLSGIEGGPPFDAREYATDDVIHYPDGISALAVHGGDMLLAIERNTQVRGSPVRSTGQLLKIGRYGSLRPRDGGVVEVEATALSRESTSIDQILMDRTSWYWSETCPGDDARPDWARARGCRSLWHRGDDGKPVPMRAANEILKTSGRHSVHLTPTQIVARDGNRLYRLDRRPTGSERTVIFDQPGISHVMADGETIYVRTHSDHLWRGSSEPQQMASRVRQFATGAGSVAYYQEAEERRDPRFFRGYLPWGRHDGKLEITRDEAIAGLRLRDPDGAVHYLGRFGSRSLPHAVVSLELLQSLAMDQHGLCWVAAWPKDSCTVVCR